MSHNHENDKKYDTEEDQNIEEGSQGEEQESQGDDEIIDLDDQLGDGTNDQENRIESSANENKDKMEHSDSARNNQSSLNENQTIKNPNVNMPTLQNIDISISIINKDVLPKEDVLNFLLNSNDLFFSPNNSNILMTENTMLKTKKKAYKVNSSLNKQKIKPNYMLTNETNSAEKTYDFHTAVKKMVTNLSKNEGNDDKLIKLLINKKELEKSDIVRRFIMFS